MSVKRRSSMTLSEKRAKWVNRVREAIDDCCGHMREQTYQELASWASNKITWLHQFGHLTEDETNELTSKMAALFEYGTYDQEEIDVLREERKGR